MAGSEYWEYGTKRDVVTRPPPGSRAALRDELPPFGVLEPLRYEVPMGPQFVALSAEEVRSGIQWQDPVDLL